MYNYKEVFLVKKTIMKRIYKIPALYVVCDWLSKLQAAFFDQLCTNYEQCVIYTNTAHVDLLLNFSYFQKCLNVKNDKS